MGLFRGARRSAGGDADRARRLREDEAALARFAAAHPGCEAFVEARAAVTDTTIVLVAATGEWTRRGAPGALAAFQLARRLGVAVFDASVVGYPQRMREWTSRLSAAARRPGDE